MGHNPTLKSEALQVQNPVFVKENGEVREEAASLSRRLYYETMLYVSLVPSLTN